MNSTIWTIIKVYFWPIIRWAFTEAYKEKFDLKILKEKAEQNKASLKKKLFKHTIETSKLAIEKFEAIQRNAEKQDWFAGTIFDDDVEFGWGSTKEKFYNWQTLPKIPYLIEVDDQREFKNIIWNVWCFIYWNSNNASMNLAIDFSKKEREAIATLWVQTKWYKENWGWYFSEWAEQIDKLLDHKKIDFQRYKLLSSSKRLYDVLDAGYSVAMPIDISEELREGLFDDWILTADEMVGNKRFGHLMNIKKNESWKVVLWIDNYPDTNEEHIFEIEELSALVRSGKFMRLARFYAPLKDIVPEVVVPEVIPPTQPEVNSSSQKAIKRLWLKDERMNEAITRFEDFSVAWRILDEIDSLDERLKKVEKK